MPQTINQLNYSIPQHTLLNVRECKLPGQIGIKNAETLEGSPEIMFTLRLSVAIDLER